VSLFPGGEDPDGATGGLNNISFPGWEDPNGADHDKICMDTHLFHPKFDTQGRHPFLFETFRHYQQSDPSLVQLLKDKQSCYFRKSLNNVSIICHRSDSLRPDWKIALPTSMPSLLVAWYHQTTLHSCGVDRLESLIRRHFFHPDIRNAVRNSIRNCDLCPKVKCGAPPHGHLAPRAAPIIPWSEVHVDFIGPWRVKVDKNTMIYNALTCIDRSLA
jgi:hypothetical protein